MRRNFFSFDGQSSLSRGLILETKNVYGGAEADLTPHEIKGRDGTVYIDNRRRKNVQITYNTRIETGGAIHLPRYLGDIKRWLMARPSEYKRLEDTYDPDHFRWGLFIGGFESNAVLHGIAQQNIIFDCLPYRYRKSGEMKHVIKPGEDLKLNNDTGFDSNPIVIIRLIKGNLDPSVTIQIKSFYGDLYSVTIDNISEEQGLIGLDGETVRIWGDGNYRNMVEEFPKLFPGKNTVTITGQRVQSAEIVPQWREL